MYKDKN